MKQVSAGYKGDADGVQGDKYERPNDQHSLFSEAV
jgi:hypothetical protein